MEHGLFTYTTAASISIQTTACTFIGACIFASAACTITIKDSAKTMFVSSTNAGGLIMITPCMPIACTAGLNVTDSGGGNYVVFYGNK